MDFGYVGFGSVEAYKDVMLAEKRGFSHAWLYDTQMLASDVYAALALCAVNTQTIKQYMAGDRKVRQWVIMAANELGLTPTTEGGSNFTMNLTLAQDGYAGLEHSLPISPF